MTITVDNGAERNEGVFDSFECAIEALAPRCAHCGCRVIGHGVESSGTVYCCAHCARESGASGVADNAGATAAIDHLTGEQGFR
ncbi:hypothetical protein V1Y59_21835 [Gordonia sp. PKS22-38]|uniref:Metallothionein n=1 Tax=Gordonia prachuapensis TaxID=3115651 RepID=A0ABU7N0L1_9ACTN|nr:hypothetical protein [Gordonia sp. PKS22-38]